MKLIWKPDDHRGKIYIILKLIEADEQALGSSYRIRWVKLRILSKIYFKNWEVSQVKKVKITAQLIDVNTEQAHFLDCWNSACSIYYIEQKNGKNLLQQFCFWATRKWIKRGDASHSCACIDKALDTCNMQYIQWW